MTAVVSCDRAILLDHNYSVAYNNKGNSLNALKHFDEALVNCDQAIALKPDFADAYNNKGSALFNLKRYDEALTSWDQAIRLNPDFAGAHNNRGGVLCRLGRFNEAIMSCDRAIVLNPNLTAAYNNRGASLNELQQFDGALKNYDHAINLNPDIADAHYIADAHFSKSFTQHLLGNFDEGLKLYEWRWKSVQVDNHRSFVQPLWLGDTPIADKTILIYEEQGLGDVVQMCRYVSMINALGASVVLEVLSPLVSLMLTLKGDVKVVGKGDDLPLFDFQCPIMSLPLAFKTTVETIPGNVPYLFSDKDKQNEWQERLGEKRRPRIGIVCSGSETHSADGKRSIPLKLMQPLFNLPFEYHILQKEIRPEDVAVLTQFPHVKIHHENLLDFADTAALVNEMDLVISVDTSVAHLAGALGKPVWILLSWVPDFRWLLDRTDSPWYPTATLFRQPDLGNWESMIEDVCQRLKDQFL